MNRPLHILTFDIEEWFHVLDHEETASERDWYRFESRIEKNTDRILSLLNDTQVKATFFCLGWIARAHPNVVRAISDAGHEVGSHSDRHMLVSQMTQMQFKNDLRASIAVLEDITGRRVRAYRAPGFSISRHDIWAFSTLAENGVEWDSSVFASPHSHNKQPAFDLAEPAILHLRGLQIKEFPVVPGRLFGQRISFSGGGYFRVLPYGMVKQLMDKSDYAMAYFHPRDFDPQQPRIPNLPLSRVFRSYVGLNTALARLKSLLQQLSFTDISSANERIDWSSQPNIYLDDRPSDGSDERKNTCLPSA